ncbi:MAG TPA: TIGR01777 family oxidoreductase, partial [Thermoanaerobaculia bacterium]|nr:TIGR01777 family oxidoreductase [Thermoanaerobaculia bacterium]
RLCTRLGEKGHDVVVLSRGAGEGRRLAGVRVLPWGTGVPGWEAAIDGADAIVNLAGESVAQRWTGEAKRRILASRLEAIARLAGAIRTAAKRPAVLVNASAVGFYGARGDEELSESAPPGDDFLARTCVEWERAAEGLEELGLRVVRVRIGAVLSAEGGALAKMIPVFRAFAGGPVGRGSQWMSWIHRDDLVELLGFALENQTVSGALNGTAPEPARNRDFAKALGRALQRPAIAPAPAVAVRLLFGEMATVVLDGQRVVPKKALALGFRFRFPHLDEALADAVGA